MAWTVTGAMAFTAFAAVVQLALAGVLLVRNPRNERVAMFGLLFLLNGVIAALTFAGTGFSEVRDDIANNAGPMALGLLRTALMFEHATNLLLVVLALVYPHRARWLRRAPHAVVVFAALFVILLAARLLFGDVIVAGRRFGWPLDAQTALLVYGMLDLVFPVMMIRWAMLWRGSMSRELRAQFGLVFAAFGVRAVHQMVFVPFVETSDVLAGRVATPAGLAIGGMIVAIIAASLAYALWLMVTARFPAKSDRAWHMFVLAFLAFGLLEGIMNIFLNRGLDIQWWNSLTGRFDTLVIRPALLWFAITRTQFLDVRLRSGQFAWAMAFVLTAAAVMGGVYEAFGDRGSSAVQWTLSAIVGVAVASTTIAVWQAVLLARSEAWSRSPTPGEVYAAQVEEAYRNGPPTPAEVLRLGRLRTSLGVEDSLHRTIERRIRAAALAQKAPTGREK